MNKSKLHYLLIFFVFSLFNSLLFNNCAGDSQKQAENSSDGTSGNAEIGTEFSGKVQGSISTVSTSGNVWGYAVDPNNKNKSLRVFFYIDGPVGSGTLIGNSLANIQSLGANAGHYFSFNIPEQYADGKVHKVYAYGYAASASFSLAPVSYSFTAYTPKGEAIYNQGINNLVTGTCNKCHSWNFKDLFYGALLSPAPTQGGSPTNNKFYQKMMGHSGGKFCTVSTDFPCSDIQTWWNTEFN